VILGADGRNSDEPNGHELERGRVVSGTVPELNVTMFPVLGV